jgi:hypothetical protein
MSYGMNFGVSDAANNPNYTTTQNRLQIDLNNPAPLFNLVTVGAGTAFSVDLTQVQSDTEQLLLVVHDLGYIPQVYTTLYLEPINPNIAPSNFNYSYGIGLVLLAEGGAGDDVIDYNVTSTTFTVNHTVQSFGGGTGSYTSYAPDYNLTIKYLICNNVGIQTITFN